MSDRNSAAAGTSQAPFGIFFLWVVLALFNLTAGAYVVAWRLGYVRGGTWDAASVITVSAVASLVLFLVALGATVVWRPRVARLKRPR
jgi:hypothetical protein